MAQSDSGNWARDPNGNLLLDENGNPIWTGGGGSGGAGGGATPPTEEEWLDATGIGFNDAYGDDLSWLNNIFNNTRNYTGQMDTTSRGMLDRVFDQSMNGSIASFDTAANRLRERTDSYANAQKDSLVGQRLGSGFQGSLRKGLSDIDRSAQFSYGQGLNDLSLGFEDRRLTGLGVANNAASARGKFDLDKYGAEADSYYRGQENSLTAARDKVNAINEARRQKLGLARDLMGLL